MWLLLQMLVVMILLPIATLGFILLSIGLVRYRAAQTRRDPVYECATTAKYVAMNRLAHDNIRYGSGLCAFSAFAVSIFGPLYGFGLLSLIALLCGVELASQQLRLLEKPVKRVELNDDNIHLFKGS